MRGVRRLGDACARTRACLGGGGCAPAPARTGGTDLLLPAGVFATPFCGELGLLYVDALNNVRFSRNVSGKECADAAWAVWSDGPVSERAFPVDTPSKPAVRP